MSKNDGGSAMTIDLESLRWMPQGNFATWPARSSCSPTPELSHAVGVGLNELLAVMRRGAEMEVGKHGYEGACAPGGGVSCSWNQETFSVGIFEWVPRPRGKGVKRGKVKVRVSGPVDMPERVYARADAVAAELDAGTYTGPKNVRA